MKLAEKAILESVAQTNVCDRVRENAVRIMVGHLPEVHACTLHHAPCMHASGACIARCIACTFMNSRESAAKGEMEPTKDCLKEWKMLKGYSHDSCFFSKVRGLNVPGSEPL
jgi:hypothetical protein